MQPDNGSKTFLGYLRESLAKIDRPTQTLQSLRKLMESAGFADIQECHVTKPTGPWPKDPRLKRVGAMVLLCCETSFESYGMAAFTRILGMDVKKHRQSATLGNRQLGTRTTIPTLYSKHGNSKVP
jgi:hypothetical protein